MVTDIEQELSGAHAATERPSVARDIPRATQVMLWGCAAGRCEFAGCNTPLWRSPLTQEAVNIGEKAHIYAVGARGPRGNGGLSTAERNDINNLLLVCTVCHTKIDRAPEGRYTAEILQDMKRRHEQRIEIVTSIHPEQRSHVLIYGANIGEHASPELIAEAASAMFPSRYPAEHVPITLSTRNNPTYESSDEFWRVEAVHLEQHFNRRVRERLAAGEISHLSVFALAPQPLLIRLGTLLGDITPAEVYQRHREPPSWSWPVDASTPDFVVRLPEACNGEPALVLALSATVTPDRIAAVLGPNVSPWVITVAQPHNDLTKSREQLGRFRSLLRTQLDRIKAAHGQHTLLHVFPVASAAMAVELGRVRMPKADMPWRIYDQVSARGGFVHALSIS